MKKCLYCSVVFVAILVFSMNVTDSFKRSNSLCVFMANVEALASGESGGQPMDCYTNVEKVDDGRPVETKTYCGDCKPIRCTHWWSQGRCMR